jgi:hypothetical protein
MAIPAESHLAREWAAPACSRLANKSKRHHHAHECAITINGHCVPTSPGVANLVCMHLDRPGRWIALSRRAQESTRWARETNRVMMAFNHKCFASHAPTKRAHAGIRVEDLRAAKVGSSRIDTFSPPTVAFHPKITTAMPVRIAKPSPFFRGRHEESPQVHPKIR